MTKKFKLLALALGLVFCLYAVWSYGLVHPNLTFTAWAPYWAGQTFLWRTLYDQRGLLVILYAGLVTLMGIGFYFWQKNLPAKFQPTTLLPVLALIALPLVLSYNALSADVFNYIFNAKMVMKYELNPHLVAPWTVADEWLRFMGNIEGLAPYGYLWTGLSIPLYLLGGEKFTLTWLIFKFFNFGGLLVTAYLWGRWSKNSRWWSLTFFNPLLLVEVLANGHNDIWMLLPAGASFLLVNYKSKAKKKFLSFLLLLISILIKQVTILLLPFWIYHLFAPALYRWGRQHLVGRWGRLLTWLKLQLVRVKIQVFFYDLIALAMFLPLLTERAQQFHPWYLSWSFLWLPFMQSRLLKRVLLIFSFSGLARYVPYLLTQQYDPTTYLWQHLLLWTPAVFYLAYNFGRQLFTRWHPDRSALLS